MIFYDIFIKLLFHYQIIELLYTYKKNQIPIGFVSWAFFSESIAQKYKQGNYHLTYDDWTSGDQLWFIDFIAPYGNIRSIVKDLKTNVFPDKSITGP